jgi:hypothetical protein
VHVIDSGTPPATPEGASPGATRDRPLAQLLVLLGLSGFAIAQPLLEILGGEPTVFTFNRVEGLAILWLALGIALLPPLALWLVGLGITALNRRVGFAVHLAIVAVLAALALLQVLKWSLSISQPVLLVVLAVAGACGFTYAYSRVGAVAEWTRYTAVLPVAAVLLFVIGSPSADLLGGPQSFATDSGGEELPPVVFVLLDEFPTESLLDADNGIDEHRFPNLAAFAEDATWYRNFTTVAPFSNQAIPAILSGIDPSTDEPLWTNYPDTLFSLLAPTHTLSVFESFTKLCGSDECVEGPPGNTGSSSPRYRALASTIADLWVDRISPSEGEGTAMDDFEEERAEPEVAGEGLGMVPSGEALTVRPQRQQDFLDAIEPSGEPALYFLHLVLPHAPFRFYADGTTYDAVFRPAPTYPSHESNEQGEWVTAMSQERHLLQAQYTDALVGEVLAKLKQTDLYDESLVVVVADHGASFKPGTPYRVLNEDNIDAIAYAPLFIKAPEQDEGGVDDANVMGIDVLPTIADIMGIDVPWAMHGSAVGSSGMTERGDTKYIQRLGGSMSAGIYFEGFIDFEDEFPDIAQRWIPPGVESYPLAALIGRLDVDELMGRSLDEVATGTDGSATVHGIARLEEPGDESPLGWVQGSIVDPPDGGVVVVEVNGRIVTASAFYGEDHFAALLPSGALDDTNQIRVALVDGDSVIEKQIQR